MQMARLIHAGRPSRTSSPPVTLPSLWGQNYNGMFATQQSDEGGMLPAQSSPSREQTAHPSNVEERPTLPGNVEEQPAPPANLIPTPLTSLRDQASYALAINYEEQFPPLSNVVEHFAQLDEQQDLDPPWLRQLELEMEGLCEELHARAEQGRST
jgi:hypothetical protein